MNVRRGVKYGLISYALLKVIKAAPRILDRQQAQIIELEDKIKFLKTEQRPFKFQVLSRDTQNDKVTVSLKFLTRDGRPVKYNGKTFVRFTIKGTDPAFDINIVKLGNLYLGFPYKLLSDAIAPAKGFTLYKYYDSNGTPLIFYPFANADEKQAYTELFNKLKADSSIAQFGQLITSFDGNRFKLNTTYTLVIHTATGGVEIYQES